ALADHAAIQIDGFFGGVNGREADAVGIVERPNDGPARQESIVLREIDVDAELFEPVGGKLDLISVASVRQAFLKERQGGLVLLGIEGLLCLLEDEFYGVAAQLGARIIEKRGSELRRSGIELDEGFIRQPASPARVFGALQECTE